MSWLADALAAVCAGIICLDGSAGGRFDGVCGGAAGAANLASRFSLFNFASHTLPAGGVALGYFINEKPDCSHIGIDSLNER